MESGGNLRNHMKMHGILRKSMENKGKSLESGGKPWNPVGSDADCPRWALDACLLAS